MAIDIKTRAAIFFYGAPNIAGCSLALGGLGLFLGGVISDWWLPICAGLYAAGALIAQASRGLASKERSAAAGQELASGNEALIEYSKGRLHAEALAPQEKIPGVVEGLAPRMAGGSMPLQDSVILANAVSRDLPTTVSNYLRLPAAFAKFHQLDGGKTCKAMLIEQRQLLDERLGEMAASAHGNDAEAMRINGMLLQEKFKPVSFLE